jgi:hypothetical protein
VISILSAFLLPHEHTPSVAAVAKVTIFQLIYLYFYSIRAAKLVKFRETRATPPKYNIFFG